MAVVSSAAPLLAQLDEDDDALRLHALQSLNSIVHEFWFQIASSLASVEAFYEDESFTHRELAALVASKVSSSGSLPDQFEEVLLCDVGPLLSPIARLFVKLLCFLSTPGLPSQVLGVVATSLVETH